MKRLNPTAELISLRCVCGKAVIRATTTKLSVGVLSATVPDEVLPCPHCGSKDLKTARELQDSKPPQK